MTRDTDRITTGSINDPMAQSIRAEQRFDAAPTTEELTRRRRQWLRNKGCRDCDETDPDKLTVTHEYIPDCTALQHPDQPQIVLCDEHYRPPKERWQERRLARLEAADAVAIVQYECEASTLAELPEFDMDAPRVESWDDVPTYHRPIPEVPIRCQCGAVIDEVITA